jgi:hypothetical protein
VNIEKVKRDEAAAAALEAAEEQRMQEVDSERRMRILRGLPVEPIVEAESKDAADGSRPEPTAGGGGRKRRRIAGEDDTERDIRYAKETQITRRPSDANGETTRPKTSNAPLMDPDGHINLFPPEGTRHAAPKNAEAEAETAQKKRAYEDQYTMRFSNAAGFKQAVGAKPWYQAPSAAAEEEKEAAVSQDVWGNEDPRRKERQSRRLATEDPLAAMQRGVLGVRQAETERRKHDEQRQRELAELIEAEKAEKATSTTRRRRRSVEGPGSVESDGHGEGRRHSGHGAEHRSRRRHHRHRSRSRSKVPGDETADPVGWKAGRGGRYSSQFATGT